MDENGDVINVTRGVHVDNSSDYVDPEDNEAVNKITSLDTWRLGYGPLLDEAERVDLLNQLDERLHADLD